MTIAGWEGVCKRLLQKGLERMIVGTEPGLALTSPILQLCVCPRCSGIPSINIKHFIRDGNPPVEVVTPHEVFRRSCPTEAFTPRSCQGACPTA